MTSPNEYETQNELNLSLFQNPLSQNNVFDDQNNATERIQSSHSLNNVFVNQNLENQNAAYPDQHHGLQQHGNVYMERAHQIQGNIYVEIPHLNQGPFENVSRQVPKKRKGFLSRDFSDEDDDEEEEDDIYEEENEEDEDANESEEYLPGGSTKDGVVGVTQSGRKVIRPKMFASAYKNEEETDSILKDDAASYVAEGYISDPNRRGGRGRGRGGRGRGRGKGRVLTYEEYLAKHLPNSLTANVFCSTCTGSHSLEHNRLVICDDCDAPYHQQCHDPPIEDFVAEEALLPWFCKNCSSSEKAIKATQFANGFIAFRIEEEKKKLEQLTNAQEEPVPETVQEQQFESEHVPSESNPPILPAATPISTPLQKRRPGRPKKNPSASETPRFEPTPNKPANKKVAMNPPFETCISCGLAKNIEDSDPQIEIPEQTFEKSDMLKSELSDDQIRNPTETATPAAQIITNVDEFSEALFHKMCTACNTLMSKEFTVIKKQTPETLALLLLQTAIRFPQLNDFLSKQTENSEPLSINTLISFSARSRYIPPAFPITRGFISSSASPMNIFDAGKKPRFSENSGAGNSFFNLELHETNQDSLIRRRTSHSWGSYEDMISNALFSHPGPRGCKPKDIFNWMYAKIPGLPDNFRASATQALKKGCDRGRFIRVDSGWYRINPDYQERPRRRELSNPTEIDKMPRIDMQQYSMHQANAAAALASMQQQPSFGQPMAMHPHGGMMPYPPTAAMAAAFASQQSYLGHPPHFMPPHISNSFPGSHEFTNPNYTNQESSPANAMTEAHEDTIFG